MFQLKTMDSRAYCIFLAIIFVSGVCDVESRKSRYRRQGPGISGQVTLYQHEEFDGVVGDSITLTLPLGHCVNLDARWNDQASSVDPQDSCVLLYEHGFCKGKGIRLQQLSFGTSKLVDVGLNDAVSSLKLC